MVADGNFKQADCDSCLYVSNIPDLRALLAVWVDDMIGCGSTRAKKLVVETLKKKFNITLIEEPTLFFGVQIERDRVKRMVEGSPDRLSN